MSDIYIDPTSGDVEIVNSDLSIVTGREAVRQQLALRLSLQKGDWPLDTREGVPWRESIMVRNPDLQQIGAIFRERILSAAGVIRIDSFRLTFDNATGLFRLDFVAITTDGDVTISSSGVDIIALLQLTLLNSLGGIS